MNSTYLFQLPSKELLAAVTHLHKLLSKVKPKPSYPILEVIVKLDLVELRLIGMSRFIKTEHKNIYSFTIPFIDLYASAHNTTEDFFSAEIKQGLINISNRNYSSDYIKLFHPENLQRFDLSINSNILDILSLRQKFSYTQLEEKNYLKVVEKEEEKLENEIHIALSHISKYGINYSILKKIIDQNILDNAQS